MLSTPAVCWRFTLYVQTMERKVVTIELVENSPYLSLFYFILFYLLRHVHEYNNYNKLGELN